MLQALSLSLSLSLSLPNFPKFLTIKPKKLRQTTEVFLDNKDFGQNIPISN
jgi:hypothetical protein